MFPLAPAIAEDGEDVHEQVDDVKVEVQGGEDVLLGAQGILMAPAYHQLGVVHDIQAESCKVIQLYRVSKK